MKTKQYRFLELLLIALLIASMFLPWIRVYGATENAFYDYPLSAAGMAEESYYTWQGALATTGLGTHLTPFQYYLTLDLTLCAIVPIAAMILLVLSFIFTCRSGKSENAAARRRLLMKWVRVCIIAQAVLVVSTCILYSLFVNDMLHPSWGILVAFALLIAEAIIQKKLMEWEKNDRRRALRDAEAGVTSDTGHTGETKSS